MNTFEPKQVNVIDPAKDQGMANPGILFDLLATRSSGPLLQERLAGGDPDLLELFRVDLTNTFHLDHVAHGFSS